MGRPVKRDVQGTIVFGDYANDAAGYSDDRRGVDVVD